MRLRRNPDSSVTKSILLVSSSLTVMAGAALAPDLPAIRAHFAGLDNVDFLVPLVLTVPALFIVIGGPIAGAIIDFVTRKGVLFASILLYAVAGGSALVLDALPVILVGRALVGLGVAGIATSVTTLIADYYAGQQRTHMMGLEITARNSCAVVFLLVGGVLADTGWRAPFLLFPIALGLLPLVAVFIFDPGPEREGVTSPDGSPPSELSVASSEAQTVQGSARLPMKLIVLSYTAVFVAHVLFFLMPVFLPFYLQELGSVSGAQTGLLISVFPLATATAAFSYKHVKPHAHYVSITSVCFALMGIGWMSIGLASNFVLVLVGLAVAGAGMGLLMPNMAVWLTSGTPVPLRGRVLGGFTMAYFLGQFMSPILTQPIRQQIGLGATYGASGVFLIILAVVTIIFHRALREATISAGT
jgi:MFS family permease